MDEEEEEHAEQGVEAEEAEEGEEGVAGGDAGGVAIGGAEDAVDEPGLAAEFGGHPAERGGDVGHGEGQEQGPKEGFVGVELFEAEGEEGEEGEGRP